MTGYEMTGEEYDILYKRHQARSSKELLELAGMKEGDRVLDLCAGSNGRATKAAIKMGASLVVPVDLNPNVKKLHRVKQGYVEPYCQDIQGFLQFSNLNKNDKFDIIICQQGINYWFDKDIIRKFGSLIKRGGVFVFNTFNKKPSTVPIVRKDEIDGLNYVEVVWTVGNMVKHVQIVEGYNPHTTEFKWIPPDYFKEGLSLSFRDVEVKTVNGTDIYICRRI